MIAERCSTSRLAKYGECESFSVNGYFERKCNAEVGFYGRLQDIVALCRQASSTDTSSVFYGLFKK